MSSGSFPRRFWKKKEATALPHRQLKNLLPGVLNKIGKRSQEPTQWVLAAWPEVIGEKLAPMAQASSYEEGVLYVKVSNSSLYSLLIQDKGRILGEMRQRFPSTAINNIIFRIG